MWYLSPLSRLARFGESDWPVDIVEIVSVELVETDLDLLRAWDKDGGGLTEGRSKFLPRCLAFLASCSSAAPSLVFYQQRLQIVSSSGRSMKLVENGTDRMVTTRAHFTYRRNKSLGTSLVSRGASLGLSNCCVLDGLETYGLSWADALHSKL